MNRSATLEGVRTDQCNHCAIDILYMWSWKLSGESPNCNREETNVAQMASKKIELLDANA